MQRLHLRAALSGVIILAWPAAAEWSNDPAVNFAVTDDAGEQTLPKLAVAPGAASYLSWFDNGGGAGYDVRLQRLDECGSEAWAHDGILVADRSYSFVFDHDLDVDGSGSAILAFNDDRFPPGDQITAARVDATGAMQWGGSGVQLTTGTAFKASPKVAATTDGGAVIGWVNDSDSILQKLDASGAPQWGGGVVLHDAGGAAIQISDLEPAPGGAVIALWVRQQGGARHLHAQKYSSAGVPLWPSPVIVFDGGSIQFGNFPTFLADGSGGGVFTWYSSSPGLQCFVQRVSSAGAEVFGHNGVAVSTLATQIRVSPSAAYDPVARDIYVFWTEESANQALDGVSGQRIDNFGVRQWGSSGVVIVPLSTVEHTQVRALLASGGATVFFVDRPIPTGQRVRAARLTTSGAFVWGPQIIDASSVLASKSRLGARSISSSASYLAWVDGRDDEGDVYVQNVNPSGSLGLNGDLDGSGDVGFGDLTLLLVAWGPCPPAVICAPDLDGDGNIGFSDLTLLLLGWGC